MNTVGNPNWLVLVGMLFMACGLVLLAKSAIGRLGQVFDGEGARRAACQRRIDGMMAVPFLAVGLALLMAAQFYRGDLGGSTIALALSAAVGLVFYWGLEGLFVEHLIDQDAPSDEPRAAPFVHPVAIAVETRPTLQIVHKS
jgi:hypothetical protein